MNMIRLALRNISGSAFRSWVVTLCALLVAAFTLTATLMISGTENSVRLALNRLGADIVVVPVGSEAKAESALLMGVTTRIWMPESNLDMVTTVPGVHGCLTATLLILYDECPLLFGFRYVPHCLRSEFRLYNPTMAH